MDALTIIWWISMMATTGGLAMWYLMAQAPGARRLCLTLLVLSMAAHLLIGQNKLWLGAQTLTVEVDQQAGEQGTYALTFRDVAGRAISIDAELPSGRAVIDEVVERLTALDEEDKPLVELAGDPVPSPNREQLLVQVADNTISPLQIDSILTARSVSQPNPSRDLFHVSLGIDLRGGVEFTCRLYDQANTVVPADQEVIDILRRRLDARGLTEPQVFRMTNGDVQVVIPGGTQADAARTRSVLESTGRLEFRKVLRIFSTGEPGNNIVELANGYGFAANYPYPVRPFDDVVHPAKPLPGQAPTIFYHLGPAVLDGGDVSDAMPTYDDMGQLAVAITMTAAGGAKNGQFTQSLFDERQDRGEGPKDAPNGVLAISFDGFVESTPFVQGPSSRNTRISGRFTQDEVDNLRTVLKAGSLTVTPRVIAEQVVGATLGKETISKATYSMLAGLGVILIAMFGVYRGLSWVATVSLAVTLSLIFVVLSVFGATLTLPGMAGLVLTVGMAVDASILIFERLREELVEDVDLATGIANGYNGAFITIVDANLTTFLTALILYVVGSGPVQGFGLTLMVGIITSMFGTVFVGRLITEWWYRGQRNIRIPRLMKPKNIRYTNFRLAALALSLVMLFGGWAIFVGGVDDTDERLDIDFTGGSAIQVNLAEAMTIDQVQDLLAQQVAADESLDLVNPDSMQLLPYYDDFAQAGTATRSWMFKTRDLVGAQVERDRADAEDERAVILRKLERARNQEIPDQATIAELTPQLRQLEERIAAKGQQLQERQDAFRSQLETAFAGKLPPEASEIRAATVGDRQLSVTLATMDQPTPENLILLQDDLAAAAEISEVSVRDTAQGVTIGITYHSNWNIADGSERDDPTAQRLATLLPGGTAAADVTHLANIADNLIDEVVNHDIQIDRAFASSQHFSPLVGDQMKITAVLALALACLVILFYVAARFEFRYGIGAIIALLHDMLITIGLLAVFGVRIDLTVVAALLTIIGYSLNDTIVVFDRIRDNIGKMEATLKDIIDRSVNQTMSRTILTSCTTLAVVLLLLIFGGEGVAAFSATLCIGLVLGTYSSVFVAAPVLLALNKGRPAKALLSAAMQAEDDEENGEENNGGSNEATKAEDGDSTPGAETTSGPRPATV